MKKRLIKSFKRSLLGLLVGSCLMCSSCCISLSNTVPISGDLAKSEAYYESNNPIEYICVIAGLAAIGAFFFTPELLPLWLGIMVIA